MSMILDVDLERVPDGKLHLVHARARLGADGRPHVTHLARRGSHLLVAVRDANCLVFAPDGDGFAAGDEVRAMLLDAGSLTALDE